MAGHSHSSNIKFRKDRVDSKRARAFAKLSRMITVAARQGGGSIDGNAKLRLSVEKARVLSMPKDVIDRAIRKGTGELDIANYEEILYEAFGPGGVAMMIEILTDNRHRTAADVRGLLEKHGGNLSTTGSVAWMFERKGTFVVEPAADTEGRPALDQAQLMELALEVGADDLVEQDGAPKMLCQPAAFSDVGQALAARGVQLRTVELAYVPHQRVTIDDGAVAERLLRLFDALEDSDDVQGVWANEQFTDDVAKALEA